MVQAGINSRYAQTQAQLYPEFNTETLSIASGQVIYDGAGAPLSYAVGLGMNGAVTALDLNRIEEFYRQRGVPAQIVLCPLADQSLIELLNAHNYRLLEFNNVWFRPLSRAESFERPNTAITVREITPAEKDTWARVVTRGFFEQEEPTTADLKIFETFARMPGTTCFLGETNGEIVAGSALTMYQNVASFFGTSTLPDFRKRGAQTALLHARLAAAVAAKCDLVTTETMPGSDSQRNVERWGFRLAYTKMTMMREWT